MKAHKRAIYIFDKKIFQTLAHLKLYVGVWYGSVCEFRKWKIWRMVFNPFYFHTWTWGGVLKPDKHFQLLCFVHCDCIQFVQTREYLSPQDGKCINLETPDKFQRFVCCTCKTVNILRCTLENVGAWKGLICGYRSDIHGTLMEEAPKDKHVMKYQRSARNAKSSALAQFRCIP